MSLRLYAGASGYSFKEWKGVFYPDTLKSDAMLGYYAERLPTVELNNTFYAMPREANVERWAATVPAGWPNERPTTPTNGPSAHDTDTTA